MNRKQRRMAQAQNQQPAGINFRGKTFAINDAFLLAVREHGLKNFQTAIEIYNLILAQVPGYAEVYNARGIALQELKRFDEALASCDKAIALKPDYAYAYNDRGNILRALERHDEELAAYEKAIAFKPDYIEAHFNRVGTLQKMKRFDEALAGCDRIIALKSDYAEAHHARGNVLRSLERFEESMASYKKALALKPDVPYLIGDLLYMQMHLCSWQGMSATFDLMVKGLEADKIVSNPFLWVTSPASIVQQKKCTELYVASKYPPAATSLWNGEKYTHDKIRIGYFSADLHNHATSYLMAQFFELHDHSKFEITAFSFGPPSTHAMRDRLENAFDHFIDVSAKSNREIAQLAREMEIDIAVDLKGFTQDSRPGIFAWRPAPIQVNYLGYPGTMGASYIDYLIADPVLIPEEHKQYYTEKIAYLPDSYQVNDSSKKISDKVFTRRDFKLPEEAFVFCSFNNNYKITPDLFDIWMRLLHRVPSSVLWLFVANRLPISNLQEEAKSRGIESHRLIFTDQVELAEHLARHRLADLFLDTFYCNAHTTASDALWAGLPLVTCLGQTFVSRVAGSLLTAVGLPELITHSHAEYEALAFELATHPDKLVAIRQKLAQNRTTTSLFNTPLFTKHIEAAYIKMWERTQTGLPPDHIYVDAAS